MDGSGIRLALCMYERNPVTVYRMTVPRWSYRHSGDIRPILVEVGDIVLFVYFSFDRGYFILPNGSVGTIIQPFSEMHGCLVEIHE